MIYILMHSRVILCCETVEIIAGEQKQTFIVHKDLLALHSIFFSNLFSEKGSDLNGKLAISSEPSLFADFVSWIYFGKRLPVEIGTTAVELWELGGFFRAPAFQNFCIDACREYCKASETDATKAWPFIEGIKHMYSIMPEGSLIRSLAVDSLSYKNPLQENERGSPEREGQSCLGGREVLLDWADVRCTLG
jgi:hypothetical protein